MDKEHFINLTNDLYRLTLLFPKKEPLRYKMRELASEILADLILLLESDNKNIRRFSTSIERNIEVLDGMFEIVRPQNWINSFEVSEIQRSYFAIKEETVKFNDQKEIELPKEKPVLEEEPKDKEINSDINERQKKILEILKNKKKAQVWEVKVNFPNITKRTIRRDFEGLLSYGLVSRFGERNETYYEIKEF